MRRTACSAASVSGVFAEPGGGEFAGAGAGPEEFEQGACGVAEQSPAQGHLVGPGAGGWFLAWQHGLGSLLQDVIR